MSSRSVLLAAGGSERPLLRSLLDDGPWYRWDVTEAGSFEEARLLAQLDACDLLLLDVSLPGCGSPDSASWLAARVEAPVVFLAEPDAEALRGAGTFGGYALLPRDLAASHPLLLHAALLQASRLADLRRDQRQTAGRLRHCRRRLKQLAGRLWECSPGAGPVPWFSQRYMLERLQQETARVRRHGGRLAVALGELVPRAGQFDPAEAQRLTTWAAQRVGRCKRRCDVAGQWGPVGFMLLLPGTSASGAASACRRLYKLLAEGPEPLAGPQPPLAAHFGIAVATPDACAAQGILRQAEESLEAARAADVPVAPVSGAGEPGPETQA